MAVILDNSTGNRISRNSIFANGGLGIGLSGRRRDAQRPRRRRRRPQRPAELPRPTSARLAGPNLVLEGFARPGSAIELFVADPDPTGFGEGRTYLVTRVEGSADDLDPSTGSYGPTVNGLAVGSDTTNRFRFVIPLASLPGVAVGTALTSTATLAGDTSEFSGNVAVEPPVAELALTKAVDPPNVAEGGVGSQAVTYTYAVTNTGLAGASDPLSGVTLADSDGTPTFWSATATATPCSRRARRGPTP